MTDEQEGMTRVERLLALVLLASYGDSPQQDKIVLLRKAGFANSEIADLLGTTKGVVGQSLFAAKSSRSKARKRK
jgi:DNA-directed RNA polymerase specialized sigma24 family protein